MTFFVPLIWVVIFFESARLNHDCSEVFSVSLLLLVPTMTFTRAVLVRVQPVAVCRSCLDFIEVYCAPFSASLRLLLCMEVCCSMMDVLECGLRLPLHI